MSRTSCRTPFVSCVMRSPSARTNVWPSPIASSRAASAGRQYSPYASGTGAGISRAAPAEAAVARRASSSNRLMKMSVVLERLEMLCIAERFDPVNGWVLGKSVFGFRFSVFGSANPNTEHRTPIRRLRLADVQVVSLELSPGDVVLRDDARDGEVRREGYEAVAKQV